MMVMKKQRKRIVPHKRGRLSRGVAATELAVCLPIIVLLVVATIEACSMVFLKQSLSVAAYEGVRTAITNGATAAEVQATCKQILSDRHVAGATIAVNPVNIGAAVPGSYVDVTVTAPCAGNSVVPLQFYRGKTPTATASMMVEL